MKTFIAASGLQGETTHTDMSIISELIKKETSIDLRVIPETDIYRKLEWLKNGYIDMFYYGANNPVHIQGDKLDAKFFINNIEVFSSCKKHSMYSAAFSLPPSRKGINIERANPAISAPAAIERAASSPVYIPPEAIIQPFSPKIFLAAIVLTAVGIPQSDNVSPVLRNR